MLEALPPIKFGSLSWFNFFLLNCAKSLFLPNLTNWLISLMLKHSDIAVIKDLASSSTNIVFSSASLCIFANDVVVLD